MAHSYRLHGACNLEVPGSNPGRAEYLSSWFCIYSAPNCSKAWSVYSAAYVYYKEPLKSFEIRVGHSSNQVFFDSRIILRSYQKLTVVRRNGTKKKYRFEK